MSRNKELPANSLVGCIITLLGVEVQRVVNPLQPVHRRLAPVGADENVFEPKESPSQSTQEPNTHTQCYQCNPITQLNDALRDDVG